MGVGDELQLELRAEQRTVAVKITAVVEGVRGLYPLMLPLHALGPIDGVRSVYFNGTAATKARVKALVEGNPQYEMVTFSDADSATAQYRADLQQRMLIVYAVLGVVAVIALFSLTSTLLTALRERRQELAVLRAVGGAPLQVTRMVMVEAMVLGAAGGVVGAVAGAVLGRSLLSLLEFGRTPVPWGVIGLGLVGSVALGALSSVVPATLARRVPVATVLQAE